MDYLGPVIDGVLLFLLPIPADTVASGYLSLIAVLAVISLTMFVLFAGHEMEMPAFVGVIIILLALVFVVLAILDAKTFLSGFGVMFGMATAGTLVRFLDGCALAIGYNVLSHGLGSSSLLIGLVVTGTYFLAFLTPALDGNVSFFLGVVILVHISMFFVSILVFSEFVFGRLGEQSRTSIALTLSFSAFSLSAQIVGLRIEEGGADNPLISVSVFIYQASFLAGFVFGKIRLRQIISDWD